MPSASNEAQIDPTPEDFDTILEAVMETPRGRWFMNEYAKRRRVADTEQILYKLERLSGTIETLSEEASKLPRTSSECFADRLRSIRDLCSAALPPQAQTSADLYGLQAKFQQSAKDMQEAAEAIQDLTARVTDRQIDDDFCAELQSYATKIFMASSLHDMTNNDALRLLETVHAIRQELEQVLADDESGPDTLEAEAEGTTAASPIIDLDTSAGEQETEHWSLSIQREGLATSAPAHKQDMDKIEDDEDIGLMTDYESADIAFEAEDALYEDEDIDVDEAESI